jgi:hypothetical protein
VGISITKSTAFRNSTQEFSNVYFYDGLAANPTVAQADALIDELVTKEKQFHSTGVTFVRGRCWVETGNKATSEMVSQKNLTGTGIQGLVTGMDKERAFLFRLRAGVDSRGNPVYLRKWYHSCGTFVGAQIPNSSILDNSTGWSQSQRDAQVAALGTIGAIGSGGTAGVLCAKSGRLPTAGALWTAHPFLEHHQLGDMWRSV